MNIFLLGILFAIVGALCGILVTKTYAGANFVPSSGCSVVGSSVVPNTALFSEDFSDPSALSLRWTQTPSTNGVLSIDLGKLLVHVTGHTSAGGSWFKGPYKAALTGEFSGDFDVFGECQFLGSQLYGGPVIGFYVNEDNYIFSTGVLSGGTLGFYANKWQDAIWYQNISNGLAGSVPLTCQMRLRRVGNVFTMYARATSGDAWAQTYTGTHAFASAGKVMFSASNVTYVSPEDTKWDNIAFTVGGPTATTTSVFTVEDVSAQTINAGSLQAFDKATFGVTTTNNPTLSFRTSDQDADGAPSWSSSKTLSQLQAEANSGKQFMAIEVTASNNGASYQFDSLQVDTYNLDVTAPSVPSVDWVMSLKGGVGFAVNVTEPTDVDYSHCEFEVKVNSGAWQKIDSSFNLGGTNYMKFRSSDIVPQPAGWVNVCDFARWGYQNGDVVQVRVRSVDGSDNKSAWVTSEEITLETTYPQPLVDSVYPLFCDPLGGTDITISGMNFRSGLSVTLNEVPCTNISVIDEMTITCKTPSMSVGHQTLRVINSDGKTDSITYQIGEANYVPVFTESSQLSWAEDNTTATWE